MEFKLIGPLHDVQLSFFFNLGQSSLTRKLFYTTTQLTDGLRGHDSDLILLMRRCCGSRFFYILRETGVVLVWLLHVVIVGNEITRRIVNKLALRDQVALLGHLMRNPG